MKARILTEKCIGCGLCVEICPEVFAMGDDVIAYVIPDEIPENATDKTRDVTAACPVDAIELL
ncbi:MAG: ferredoxin [Clostridiaceae bacterium]|jgi:ferredoxin|nr:ferredoxin [Clostridiaceae bacterium]